MVCGFLIAGIVIFLLQRPCPREQYGCNGKRERVGFPHEQHIVLYDCLECHHVYDDQRNNILDPGALYEDNPDIRCIACHNSPHAEYPARNAFGKHRDNTQPMQYGGKPFTIGSNFSCMVCHKQKMEFSIHHPNMERMFRNTEIAKKNGLLN